MREIERRFRALDSLRRRRHAKAVAEFVAALIQVHEAEHRLAQQLSCQLQRAVAGFGGDGARIDARAAAEGREAQIEVALVERGAGRWAQRGGLRTEAGRRGRRHGGRMHGARCHRGRQHRARFRLGVDFEGPGHHVPGSTAALRRRGLGRPRGLARRTNRLAVGVARGHPVGHRVARLEERAQVEIRAQVVGGGFFHRRRGPGLSVVGNDGGLVGREVVALVDGDEQLVLPEAQVIAVLQHIIVILPERHLGAVHVGSVRARVHQHIRAGTKIDSYMLPREIAIRVG